MCVRLDSKGHSFNTIFALCIVCVCVCVLGVCRTGILEGSVMCICGVQGDMVSWQRLAETSWFQPLPRPSLRHNRYTVNNLQYYHIYVYYMHKTPAYYILLITSRHIM